MGLNDFYPQVLTLILSHGNRVYRSCQDGLSGERLMSELSGGIGRKFMKI